MRYLGVSRAETFSPNRVSGDAAVFRAVALELERHGHQVVCMTELELVHDGIPAGTDAIFQMARSREALDILAASGLLGQETKLTQKLYATAAAHPQRVVFAEGVHPTMLKAAVQAKAEPGTHHGFHPHIPVQRAGTPL